MNYQGELSVNYGLSIKASQKNRLNKKMKDIRYIGQKLQAADWLVRTSIIPPNSDSWFSSPLLCVSSQREQTTYVLLSFPSTCIDVPVHLQAEGCVV